MVPTNGHGYREVDVDDRSVGELFQDLTQDARNLVMLELTMGKAEMTQKASLAGKDVGLLAAGGFIIYAGFLAIVLAVIIGLASFIPAWLSALIVGVVVALIGYVLVRKGMSDLKSRDLAPSRTLATLREDKEWVQKQVT